VPDTAFLLFCDSLLSRIPGIAEKQCPPPWLSYESIAKSFGDGFGFGVDLQFLIDAFYVEADCVERDAELGRGGFVIVSFNQQFQQPQFVWR